MSARIERRRDRIQEWLHVQADRKQAIARQVERPDSLCQRAQGIVYRTAALTLPTSACRSVSAWQEWAGALDAGRLDFWGFVLPLMDPDRLARESWFRSGADPVDVLASAVGHFPTAIPPSAPGHRLVWALDGLVEARLDEITDGSPREVYDRLCHMAIAANEAVLIVWRLAGADWGLARGWPR